MNLAAALRPRLGFQLRITLAVACALVGVVSAHSGDWHPLWLFVGLGICAIASDLFVVVVNADLSLSAALLPIVVAGIFLGPLPAAAIGAASSAFDGIRRAIGTNRWLGNSVSYAAIGLTVGFIGRVFDIQSARGTALMAEVAGTYVLASGMSLVFAAANAISPAAWFGVSRNQASATAPAEALLATGAGVAALLYRDAEYEALLLLGVVGLLFNYFAGSLVAARRYADEMKALAARESRLTARLAEAQSSTRRELAEALHSGPLQTLLSVRQDLVEQRTSAAQVGVVTSLQELRDLMVDVYVPPTPGDARASLEGLVRALEQRHGTAIALDVQLDHASVEPRHMRLALDASQELLRNAAKHARATAVDCRIRQVAGSIVVEVADDGIGLDSTALERALQGGHVGIAALRARVLEEGGRLMISPATPRGTAVTVEIGVPSHGARSVNEVRP